MALSTAVISYDFSDLSGVDFDERRTRVWVTTNIESDTIADTVGNQTRVGDARGSLAADGTGSVAVWVPGTGSNPSTWQTYLHLEHTPRRPSAERVHRTYGPFTVTTSANLADLIAEQAVPPTYLSAVTAELQTYVDAAEAARDDAQASADIASAVMALVLAGTGSPEGVVTATVGTSYRDTAATNGAVEWIKVTGSGNTGWQVAQGDTGWRTLPWGSGVQSGNVDIRRVNEQVYMRLRALVLVAGSGVAKILEPSYGTSDIPTGFQPLTTRTMSYVGKDSNGITPERLSMVDTELSWVGTGSADPSTRPDTGLTGFLVPFPTHQAWPTSLPGTAV